MDEADFDKQLEGTTKLITSLNINQEPTLSKPVESGTNGVNGDKAKYNKLIEKAKELGRQGQLERALGLFEKAYKIHNGEKLWRKIEKLKEAIERYKELEEEEDEEEEEDDNGMREVGDGFYLSAEIYRALYPYQLEGIRWFWRLHQQGEGGILGDDMGLGKTIQVVSFLAGMFDAGLIKSALIVMPVSLLSNWEKEFNKWAPGIRVLLYHGSNKNERLRNLEKIQRRRGVCLTTYGLIQTSFESLGTTSSGSTFMWDYIILDEGHKIKNPTKTSKNVREIPAKSHFILTGTPVQNNLREMWALFDFACEGKLLGTSRTFKQQYENPIVRARERDASSYEKRMGMEMSESLRKLIEPHFLRRTKAMVLENKKKATEHVDGPDEAEKENRPENAVRMPESLTRKNDLIIWLYMSDTQQKIYSEFLGLERVKELLMSTRSPLAELNVLKKVCDHPRLLSTLACEQLGLDEEDRLVELDSAADNDERSFANEPKGLGPSDRMLTQESGKMVFLVALLKNLKCEGHRCLVFSQSRKMLDIIQRVITHMGHKVLRIDGTVTKVAERQRLINTFQTDPSYSCFLLTTQVGGVGITLTSADRVVIFDPSWNPATDAQAVDRVYRIGQKKTVIIYRLITCGTLEEKIYRKQIFKDALMKQTTGVSKNPFRYFTNQELRDLFTLDDPYTSKTQMQLEEMHARHRKTDDQLDKHIEFIHTLNIFGISDHDLMYSQEEVETPDELNTHSDNDAIQARVLHAQNLMAAEARLSGQIRPGGAYPPAGIPPGVMALPQGLRHSLPVDENNMSARQKIQARIDSERFIIPTNQDTKRFQPSQIVQAPLPMPVVPSPIVVDLCSPSPAKTSTTPSPMPSPMPSPNGIALDLCTPDHVQSSPHPSPVEISHAVDEHQEEGLGQTPSPAPNRKAVDVCTPDPEQNSPYQSPVEINHLPSLSEILAEEEQSQDEGLEQTPAQNSSHQPPVEISHLSFTELQVQNEKPQGEGLEEEFSSLHIENHSTNSVRESSSPVCESHLNASLEKQTLEKSCHVLEEDISRDQHEPHQCPTGQHVSVNVNIQKCVCLVSEEEQARYDSYINNGRRFEHKGQTKEAIAQYLNALELQNSDLKLHMKVLQLAQGFNES